MLLDTVGAEEILLLLNKSQNNIQETQVPRSKLIHLDRLDDSECMELFRFKKGDIHLLARLLKLPEKYVCENRTTASGIEGLLILLRRLTYPNRLCELEKEFGRSKTELSLLFNVVLKDLYDRFHHKVTSLEQANWLDLQGYSRAIQARGSPVPNCWGFIDGTNMNTCRPIYGQQSVYSGHKRQHCLKFQGIMTPCGIIAHMFGPIEGSRHDAFMLAESGILNTLSSSRFKDYCIYGDPAYPLRPQLLAPFSGELSEAENSFNKQMATIRQSVEWGFGKLKTNFAFLDFKKNLKILLQPVGMYFVVGTILINCQSCLYGSQTSTYFQCDPPTLEDYLRV